MKARVPVHGVGRKLLAFGATEENRILLGRAAERFGAEMIFTDDGETPICRLLGEDGAEGVPSDSAEYPAAAGECLMIAGFDRDALNELLYFLRESGLRLPLKAVYTPTNRTWSVAHLINELAAEHKFMTEQRKKNGREDDGQ